MFRTSFLFLSLPFLTIGLCLVLSGCQTSGPSAKATVIQSCPGGMTPVIGVNNKAMGCQPAAGNLIEEGQACSSKHTGGETVDRLGNRFRCVNNSEKKLKSTSKETL